MPIAQLLLEWSVVAIFAGAVVFIVAYRVLTNWSATALGRHMMWFMLVILALTALAIMRYLHLDNFSGVLWVRAIVFFFGAVVVWQRVWLLFRYQTGRPTLSTAEDTCPECQHPMAMHTQTGVTSHKVCTVKGCRTHEGCDVHVPEEG